MDFPKIDLSASQAEIAEPERPSMIKDWAIFGLAFTTIGLGGLCLIQWGQITKRFEPKIVEKEVEVFVEKEVPVEVIKEVEKVVEVKSSNSTMTDFGFNQDSLELTEGQILNCFQNDGDFRKLKFVQDGTLWRDEDAGINLKISRNDRGEINGVQLISHVNNMLDAKIEGTGDHIRLMHFAIAMSQMLKIINPDIVPFVPQWLTTTLLQPNSFSHCDMLDTRVFTQTIVIGKNAGMLITGGIGTDPDHDSGKRK